MTLLWKMCFINATEYVLPNEERYSITDGTIIVPKGTEFVIIHGTYLVPPMERECRLVTRQENIYHPQGIVHFAENTWWGKVNLSATPNRRILVSLINEEILTLFNYYYRVGATLQKRGVANPWIGIEITKPLSGFSILQEIELDISD